MITIKIPDVINNVPVHPIPGHQKTPMIERFAAQKLPQMNIKTDRKYLPVYWSDYHASHGWGSHTQELQMIITKVVNQYPNDKFFTISQGDDGTLVNIPRCKIFSGGGTGDVPIPLLCDLQTPPKPPTPRFFASFMGSVCGRHKVRENMCMLRKDPGIFITETGPGQNYSQMFIDSKFALAPRGYGKTSFRMYEAIRHGTIPVYLGDISPHDKNKTTDLWLPYSDQLNWEEFAVLVHCPQDLPDLAERLRAISDEKYAAMKKRLLEVAPKFTMEGTCDYIKWYLENKDK